MTMNKALMPVPEGHPAVFDREWPLPLRVAIDADTAIRRPGFS